MTQETVSLQRDGAIAHVVLNRPPVMNAININLLRALAGILDDIAEDGTTRVVLLTGSGSKAFSAGADINYLSRASAHEVRDFALLAVEVTRRIEALGKPVIAVLNGHALGGGLELAEA